ncbi:MAG: 30S ribosomal protein S4 [Candidatus Latescibacterota bacterium]|nr:MAG: 30S ribosomal protein S4 [Candidatus Latescibacterota bacterium]
MARYVDAVCKMCRREGIKLFLKGDRCYTEKCAIDRRAYPPGEHGQARRRPRKMSEYGMQLREKQKLRRVYGVLERQFRHYFARANRMEGITGERLLQLLERRLDNVVYRMGFAPSRPAARQLIRHGHIRVRGRKVNIPSFRVKPGDVITVREKSRQLPVVQDALKGAEMRPKAPYVEVDRAKLEGTFLTLPSRVDIPMPVEEQLIVELYSK